MLIRRAAQRLVLAAGFVFYLVAGTPCFATFDLWDLNEIFSNEDGTIQFVELFTEFTGQNFTGGQIVQASQAGSSNVFVFPSNLAGNTAGKHLLLATAGFSSLPGAVQPDFILQDNFLFRPDGLVNFLGAIPPSFIDYDELPTDGVTSLNFDGTTGINSPTNFAGETGSIDLSGPQVPAITYAGALVLAVVMLGLSTVVRRRRA